MRIYKPSVNFALICMIIKLVGSIFYFSLHEEMQLDSIEVFFTYCLGNVFQIGTISNNYLKFLISSTCNNSFDLYFFLIIFIQLMLVYGAAYVIHRYANEYKNIFLIFLVSPTFFFYSSSFTKDGFVFIFLLLTLYKNTFLFYFSFISSIVIRPQVLAASPVYFFKNFFKTNILNIIFYFFFGILCIYAFYNSSAASTLYSEAFIKFSVTQSRSFFTSIFSMNNIFYLEVIFFTFLMYKNKLLPWYIFISAIILFYFAGYNPNVFSRMVLTLYLASFLLQVKNQLIIKNEYK